MPNVMDENTEYLLVFTITSGQDNVYYYSRIMPVSYTHLDVYKRQHIYMGQCQWN